MSDSEFTQEVVMAEGAVHPVQKRMTIRDIEKRLIRTHHEVYIKLLKSRYKYTVMSYNEWMKVIDDIGKETV